MEAVKLLPASVQLYMAGDVKQLLCLVVAKTNGPTHGLFTLLKA